MSRDSKGLDISILGRDFRVACPASEQDALLAAAEYLDSKMREIREQGKVIGVERIAVMAALNIAFELQNKPKQNGVDISVTERRIEAMSGMIDEVLRPQDTLFDVLDNPVA
ncbi:cell division protein ZapA [Sulfuriferula nivalis]|jgi:cell division protein ZapA|uniref:Cell division protein ZapA n=1 Tax=Sulfuriferula nivalis TaxID=2675298 RepID=A0A809RK67_9PROT|nr:cell division protein ZapA [Sulfuriferula nivalis]BBP02349.1 cell division protein ZapA [Sulfuriferula nivalis]